MKIIHFIKYLWFMHENVENIHLVDSNEKFQSKKTLGEMVREIESKKTILFDKNFK